MTGHETDGAEVEDGHEIGTSTFFSAGDVGLCQSPFACTLLKGVMVFIIPSEVTTLDGVAFCVIKILFFSSLMIRDWHCAGVFFFFLPELGFLFEMEPVQELQIVYYHF